MVKHYEHKLYVPTIYGLITFNLKEQLSKDHGGCSRVLVHGSWKGEDLDICSEPVGMISCITDKWYRPVAMDIAIRALLDAGEESVLYTLQEIHAEFISE